MVLKVLNPTGKFIDQNCFTFLSSTVLAIEEHIFSIWVGAKAFLDILCIGYSMAKGNDNDDSEFKLSKAL